MKTRASWLIIPAVALGLGACNKKQEAKAPVVPAAVAETSPAKDVPVVPEVIPAVPKIGAEQRAAKLGFVRYLPQDTEVVVAFYNGSKVADRVKGSKLWKLVESGMNGDAVEEPAAEEEEMNQEPDEAPDAAEDAAEDAVTAAGEAVEAAAAAVAAAEEATDEEKDDAAAVTAAETPEEPATDEKPEEPTEVAQDEEPFNPAALFGSEVTLALGKTTGEQAGNLFTLNRRSGYFQTRVIAKAFAAAVKSGDVSTLDTSFASGYSEELVKDLLNDPQSGIALVEKAQMPPVYLAFRIKESDRPAAAQQVATMLENLAMLGDSIEPLKVEVGGHSFEGSKVLGAKISSSMAENRASMDEKMGATTVDRLLAAVAKKDLVVVSGTVGDYVLVFMGGSTADLKLASGLGDSIVSGDTLAFSDAYATKDIAALTYGQKAAMDQMISAAGGLADMTNGLRDGLAGADGLGDMRDLDAMFQIVAEREAALRKLAGNDASGAVAFFEEGLKIESFGGYDYGMVDWKSPHKLASLGESEDVVIFADMTGDAVYDEKARDYAEALLETAYALTMKVAEAPIKAEEFVKFQEMAKMFDTKFRPDMLALWEAFSNDFGGSLGHESALVVDLKGGAPAVPGIPQALLEKTKIPRISIVSPVTDRAKLSASWDKMNTTLTGTLTKISEMTGQEIPMQKPMSSERGGNTTWFFPMPFLTDDFVPSVTVGDKWFAASTSKNLALDLISKAGAPGPARAGFWFSMNFKALEKYSNETFALVDENTENMTGSPLPEKEKAIAQQAISILSGLDKLTIHARREGSIRRSSVHFKTR
jgi:hypothetical protein